MSCGRRLRAPGSAHTPEGVGPGGDRCLKLGLVWGPRLPTSCPLIATVGLSERGTGGRSRGLSLPLAHYRLSMSLQLRDHPLWWVVGAPPPPLPVPGLACCPAGALRLGSASCPGLALLVGLPPALGIPGAPPAGAGLPSPGTPPPWTQLGWRTGSERGLEPPDRNRAEEGNQRNIWNL